MPAHPKFPVPAAVRCSAGRCAAPPRSPCPRSPGRCGRSGAGRGPAPAAQLTEQDLQDVHRIEAYLTGIKSLKARFQQFSQNGGLIYGNIYLRARAGCASSTIPGAGADHRRRHLGQLLRHRARPAQPGAARLDAGWFLLRDR